MFGPHIRKTPKPRRPATGPLCTADRDRPRTVRVSRGSMMPSSYSRAVTKKECDSASIWASIWAGAGPVRLLVERPPGGRGRGPADDRHHPGELGRAHHGELGPRPGEHQARVVGPAGHAVVAGAERGRHVDGQVRDRGVGHRVDHLRAVLDDAALLVAGADHVAGRVLQEHQRRVGGVGQQDELAGLLGLLAEQHAAVVGQHPDRVAVHPGPAGDQRGAVQRLVLVELRAVRHAGEDLARVERDLHVGGDDAEDLVGVVPRLGHRSRRRSLLAPVDPGHDGAAEADRVELVDGEVVGEPGDPRVHLGAAERLVVGFLAGGHLHQRRAAEEHLGLAVHQDRVVAHAGHVGAARGGVAEHQRHRGNGQAGQLGQLVEDPPGRDEQVGLGRQVGAARLHQVHHRQPVHPGDLQRAQGLAQRVRVHRAAPDGRVVRDDHALDAGDHPEARHYAGADGEPGPPGGQRGQLEERAVRVDEQLDPLPGQQLAPVAVPLLVAFPAAGDGQLELLVQLFQHGELGGAVGAEGLAVRLDVGRENRHPVRPPCSDRRARTAGRSSGSCRSRSWAAGRRR